MNKTENKQIKYIFREVEPEWYDYELYFDCDCFSEAAGDYCYTLFIINNDRGHFSGINNKEYEKVWNDAENLIDAFNHVCPRSTDWHNYASYKEAMEDYGILYSPNKCHALKEWHKDIGYVNTPEDIAAYLTIITGEQWNTTSARGYCQGDYVDIIYCEKYYKQIDAQEAGEIFLGAAKEFDFITLDENGEEIENVGGFFVADCMAWKDEDAKKMLCKWEGVSEEETQVEFIDNCATQRVYSYRIA